MEALTKKEIDCNKLILENDSLIEKYKNTYNKTIEYISKNGFRVLPTDSEWSDEEKQRANENEVERYISIVQEEFYTQIIKSIIILDKQLYTVFEKPIITKQLQELSDIFFVDLESETDTAWHIIAKRNIQAQKERFYNNGITYPKAENFTKDYVLGIIQTLLPNKKSNSEKEVIKIHGQNFYLNSKDDNTRYTLAFKIADGTVYKLKNEYPNFGIPLIKAVFKNEIDLLKTELENKGLQEKEIKKEVDKYINKFRGYLNSTLRDKDNSSNDLFKLKEDMFSENQKDTKEMWLNVIEHLNKCNIPICEIFKEEFKKTYKQNI